MNGLEAQAIDCPYCGERIEIIVDCSVPAQEYIEDCSVCCRPISLTVVAHEQGQSVIPARDDE